MKEMNMNDNGAEIIGAASQAAEPTKVDLLFYLGAYRKKVNEAFSALKSECDAEFLEDFNAGGATTKRSRLFGKGAGSYVLPLSDPQPEREQADYAVADPDAFEEWLIGNPQAAVQWSLRDGAALGEWWLSKTGELPDGVSRTAYTVPASPSVPLTPRLTVKPQAVADAVDAALLERVQRLALGEGER